MKVYKYKYFTITEEHVGVFNTYQVTNTRTGNVMGRIEPHKRWKGMVFVPYPGFIWSSDCLDQLCSFLRQRTLEVFP